MKNPFELSFSLIYTNYQISYFELGDITLNIVVIDTKITVNVPLYRLTPPNFPKYRFRQPFSSSATFDRCREMHRQETTKSLGVTVVKSGILIGCTVLNYTISVRYLKKGKVLR
jgi:hypothetical protein